ncbi:PAS domain-containing protein [Butyricicoccus faecihominis]|uniref:helix-turn-helix transcriptional regulator n=1 Tax=Butyricicoccaceae TaxID=3085642 RepID=UPI00247AE711|nr:MULTISPECIES: PAS domain-containing protein [Butyricicoccaceae]MCQ5129375.1 PAS domain-containing protein [Butyricicoccus faecihominis]WNX85139.1 PAS domain-containing protein [Agathobaculum sp. NTUH-O15-33]
MATPLLQHYVKLTEFLGEALGPDYEIALHDLTDRNRSIIAIANSHVSGRQVGAPLTNVALQILMDKTYESSDYLLHYRGVSANGKMLRSSTLFIKQGARLIGMLCINFDDSRYQSVSDDILRLCHPDAFIDENLQLRQTATEKPRHITPPTEIFHNTIDAVAADAVGRELDALGVTAERATADERVQIIAALEASGIFLLKGAVKDVADALHCSQASVYRYLSQVKKEE